MRDRLFSRNTPEIEHNECQVLILGESHKEAHTIKLIRIISEVLRQYTNLPIAYAYEFFKTYDRTSAQEKLSESAEVKLSRARKCEENINECNRLLKMCEEGSQELLDLEKVITLQQEQILGDLQQANQLHLEVDYLSALDKLDIGYFGIDVEDEKFTESKPNKEEWQQSTCTEQMIIERDQHMTNQIIPLIKNNKIVLVHVGALHIDGIITNLLKMGVKPEKISAYIVQSTRLQREDYQAIADYFDVAFKRFANKDPSVGEILRKIERFAPYLKSNKKGVTIDSLVVDNDTERDGYIKIAVELIKDWDVSSLPTP